MEIFKLRISNRLFEQSPLQRHTLNKTGEHSIYCNVEKPDCSDIEFLEYIVENGKEIGVRLECQLGHGYGFDNGSTVMELFPGEVKDFSYEGTSVDDDGCPEDYVIDYYLSIYPWDEVEA